MAMVWGWCMCMLADLCDQLSEGKAKAVRRFDVQTSGNCLRLILRSLKAPLIADTVARELMRSLEIDGSATFEGALRDAFEAMTRETRDTFGYLVIHLKVGVSLVDWGIGSDWSIGGTADDRRCRQLPAGRGRAGDGVHAVGDERCHERYAPQETR